MFGYKTRKINQLMTDIVEQDSETALQTARTAEKLAQGIFSNQSKVAVCKTVAETVARKAISVVRDDKTENWETVLGFFLVAKRLLLQGDSLAYTATECLDYAAKNNVGENTYFLQNCARFALHCSSDEVSVNQTAQKILSVATSQPQYALALCQAVASLRNDKKYSSYVDDLVCDTALSAAQKVDAPDQALKLLSTAEMVKGKTLKISQTAVAVAQHIGATDCDTTREILTIAADCK